VLFDWLATLAVRHAQGSAKRLFLIVYEVGTLVTAFLSNNATAVVLTPAVYATATAARVEPLPYLFICAFIANAASFVLPISNPANLVIFGARMPPLGQWLYQFLLPSMASILVTYAALRFTQHKALDRKIAEGLPAKPLSVGGKCVALGIGLTAAALLAASAFDRQLGLPTFVAVTAVTVVVLLISR
jgi:arsenical pump membrane protein